MEVPAGRPTHGGKNADERAPFKGKRPGHNSNGNRQLFKEGTSERPQRTLNWKLGVEARFETGLSGVPSFSSSFSGNETMVGGELFGITKLQGDPFALRCEIDTLLYPYRGKSKPSPPSSEASLFQRHPRGHAPSPLHRHTSHIPFTAAHHCPPPPPPRSLPPPTH